MKKATKSLWLYAATLFIIAIALISTATLMQARLVSSDGNIEVLGTFTKNTKQSIENLTNENIELANKLNEMTNAYNTLKTDFENVFNDAATQSRHKEIMRQMYSAYANDDYDSLDALFKKINEQSLITEQEANQFIPGFFARAKRALNEYKSSNDR